MSGGTRLGRQELDGLLLEDVEGSLWSAAQLDAARVAVESQPVDSWADRVLAEADPQARIAGAVALARQGNSGHRAGLLKALLELDPGTLSEGQFLASVAEQAAQSVRRGSRYAHR